MIKILAIDSNQDDLVLLQAMFKTSFPDAVCNIALSGIDGIGKAKNEPHDIILLDLTLPSVDGVEICKLLKEDPDLKKIPVVILTARTVDDSMRLKALQFGADSFLTKPVAEAELIAIVSAMIRLKKSEEYMQNENQRLEQIVADRTRSLQVQLEELKKTERELKNSYADLEITKMASLNLMEDLRTEIDQRKRSEEILQESQKKYMELSMLFRSISDNMTDLLWARDLEKRFIFTNKAICDRILFANDTDEPIGKTDQYFTGREQALHPDDPEWYTFGESVKRDSDQVVLDLGKPAQFEEFGNVRGKFLYLDVRKSPLYDINGNIIGTVGSAQDITNEQEVTKQLEQSERQMSTLISNLPGMVYRSSHDPVFTMLFVSDGCHDLTGYTREEFVEKSTVVYSRLIHEGFSESRFQKWNAVLDRGEMFEDEYPIRTSTGDTKWVWERGRGVYDDNGDVLYLEGYVEDISTRRAAEEIVIKMNDELEQHVRERTAQLEAANKELEAFSYSVSHDLRAPLRAIDGFTRILFEDYQPFLDDEGKRVCSVIQDNAVRMGQLIDDLLSLSRLNRTDLNYTRINMESLAKTVFSEITEPEEKKRAKLSIDHFLPVMGDRVLLRQVLTNLLGNAVKFSSHRQVAEITLSSEKKSDVIVYCVHDNGAGFDMKYLDKLFGAFQRLHSTKEFEGTGIGLAIVQRIVHRHGGKVWAEGKVDQGASFYFSLPLNGKLYDNHLNPTG